MWITDASKNHYDKTRAESHSTVYLTTLELTEKENQIQLKMIFNSISQTLSARIMCFTMGPMFKKETKKAL